MNKRFTYAIVLAAVAAVGLWAGWQMERDRATVAYNKQNLIRFHVIANSNAAEDQALKYQVRDVVVKAMAERFKGVDNVTEAREIVRDNLDDIRDLAAAEIKARGFNYPVAVSLGNYQFPTKSYNLGKTEGKTNFLTLPAGTYEAVRVVIGEGNGTNWWCILFPPLCFVDFNTTEMPESLPVAAIPDSSQEDTNGKSEGEDTAVEAFKLTSPQEVEFDEGGSHDAYMEKGSIQFRFRCVELYNDTLTWFSRTFDTGRA